MVWMLILTVLVIGSVFFILVVLRLSLVFRIGGRRVTLAAPRELDESPVVSVPKLFQQVSSKLPKLPTRRDDEADKKATIIVETLAKLGVPAEVVDKQRGPRVTRIGLHPGEKNGRRVKVSAVTSLANDLQLALASKNISIEAPVAGQSYVGIEVVNDNPDEVTLKEVVGSAEFKRLRQNGALAVALGRGVVGEIVTFDLAKAPHVLIGGATGSGKSVCINSLIASLLLTWKPEELQLLMIDPKMVELIGYNGIPHLVAPVVTDMEKAIGALVWVVKEMKRRLALFSAAGKRNIRAYNMHTKRAKLPPVPYLVVIIDELADLMMTSIDEVEPLICRLAQMARATGIHLVLATQRPSVNVVTGLIKANVPIRIAFAVASQVDSRVILDVNGAEKLLGRGDMFYKASDALHPQRVQGCFASDAELDQIIADCRLIGIETDLTNEGSVLDFEVVAPKSDEDDLLPKAIKLAKEHKSVSISFLQRKLRIGYSRAARLMDALKERGIMK